MVAYGHTLASVKSLPGVSVEADATDRGIEARIVIGAGVVVEQPIHLCLGLYQDFGVQDVRLDLTLEPRAQATLWAHCLFATPLSARHAMQGEIRLMEGAVLRHQEAHYHGTTGDIEVTPHARVRLDKGARYVADFSLIQGRVGRLDIDYTVDVGEAALAELTSRIYGFGSDAIRLRERLCLNGVGARGLLKSRVAVRDRARAEVIGVVEGNAAGARGHMDCMEIVRDHAEVSAVPEVRVRHPQAKVTHEAAIGSVDSRQLETLMARGLAPDEAVDLIVRGMLA
ncbi:MAG: SufD family Fe-S cluster assembly protein [Rubrivivax sp.]|nr:SufD family Fe-S cluster assembly protein [Rubrivivax sp.]